MFCSYTGTQITQVVFFLIVQLIAAEIEGLSEVYLKDFMSVEHK